MNHSTTQHFKHRSKIKTTQIWIDHKETKRPQQFPGDNFIFAATNNK
jgi:hypothetical protein